MANSTWLDLEDALICQAAFKVKADVIVSRNGKDFDKSSIRVTDCDELFAWIESEYGKTYDEVPWQAGRWANVEQGKDEETPAKAGLLK